MLSSFQLYLFDVYFKGNGRDFCAQLNGMPVLSSLDFSFWIQVPYQLHDFQTFSESIADLSFSSTVSFGVEQKSFLSGSIIYRFVHCIGWYWFLYLLNLYLTQVTWTFFCVFWIVFVFMFRFIKYLDDFCIWYCVNHTYGWVYGYPLLYKHHFVEKTILCSMYLVFNCITISCPHICKCIFDSSFCSCDSNFLLLISIAHCCYYYGSDKESKSGIVLYLPKFCHLAKVIVHSLGPLSILYIRNHPTVSLCEKVSAGIFIVIESVNSIEFEFNSFIELLQSFETRHLNNTESSKPWWYNASIYLGLTFLYNSCETYKRSQ